MSFRIGWRAVVGLSTRISGIQLDDGEGGCGGWKLDEGLGVSDSRAGGRVEVGGGGGSGGPEAVCRCCEDG